MSQSLVICEKSSQARAIRAAVGTRYGPVLPAQGHIVTLVEPDECRDEWKTWSPGLLWPGRFFPKKAVPATRHLLEAIAARARNADRVVIATDCDREGQLIGEEILDHIDYRGERLRAVFNAEDPKTLRQAFSQLRDNREFRGLYDAGRAREQSDQAVNLSLTRTATVTLKRSGAKAIGIGRVKTPVLAIVCRREAEIRDFKPRDLFEVRANVRSGDHEVVLTCAKRPHAKSDDTPEPEAKRDDLEAGEDALADTAPRNDQIVSKEVAEALAKGVVGYRGTLRAKSGKGRESPPKLFDLTALQSAASARFGWTGERTLTAAQVLYAEHTLITYPRSESQYLPEGNVADVPALLAGLLALSAYAPHASLLAKPNTRRGKAGHFSDRALEGLSHYAIVPNVNCADQFAKAVPKLAGDAAKLFDLIARRYLAALAPDHEFLQSQINLPFPWRDEEWLFEASGRTSLAEGWRLVCPPTRTKGARDRAEPTLPPIADGARGEVEGAKVRTVVTRPPARYTEGGIIRVMKEAWRLVEDPKWRARLKEAKGIGTPATRSDVVKGLLAQGQLERKGKALVPSEGGMALYAALSEVVPNVCDPARTALWETLFDRVASGELSANDAVDRILDATRKEIDRLASSKVQVTLGPDTKPTKKMADYAKEVAKSRGIGLPRGTLSSYEATRAFLDAHTSARPHEPSGKAPSGDRSTERKTDRARPPTAKPRSKGSPPRTRRARR